MARILVPRALQLFFEKGEDYTDYPMMEGQHYMTGGRDSPMVSDGFHVNLLPSANPTVYILPEGVDDAEDWDFDGAVGEESAQLSV